MTSVCSAQSTCECVLVTTCGVTPEAAPAMTPPVTEPAITPIVNVSELVPAASVRVIAMSPKNGVIGSPRTLVRTSDCRIDRA